MAPAADSVQEYLAVGVRVASEQGLAWWELVLGEARSEPAMAVVPVESELPVECWVFALPSSCFRFCRPGKEKLVFAAASSDKLCSNGGQLRNAGSFCQTQSWVI